MVFNTLGEMFCCASWSFAAYQVRLMLDSEKLIKTLRQLNEPDTRRPVVDRRKEPVYITIMRRWGDYDGHTYITSLEFQKDSAIQNGKKEKAARSGKYEFEVIEFLVGDNKGMPVFSTCPGPNAHKLTERLARRAKKYGRPLPGSAPAVL